MLPTWRYACGPGLVPCVGLSAQWSADGMLGVLGLGFRRGIEGSMGFGSHVTREGGMPGGAQRTCAARLKGGEGALAGLLDEGSCWQLVQRGIEALGDC